MCVCLDVPVSVWEEQTLQTASFLFMFSSNSLPFIPFLNLFSIYSFFPLYFSPSSTLTLSPPLLGLKAILHHSWTQQWFNRSGGSSRGKLEPCITRPEIDDRKKKIPLQSVSCLWRDVPKRGERESRLRPWECLKRDREQGSILIKIAQLGDRQDKRVMAVKYHHYNVSLS